MKSRSGAARQGPGPREVSRLPPAAIACAAPGLERGHVAGGSDEPPARAVRPTGETPAARA